MNRQPLFVRSSLAFDANDLFKYAQEKGVKMPEDEMQWEQAISDHVASYMPYLTQYPISVEFEEKDPKRGYAKGILNVANQISIPLIMQNFRLMPLDVMGFQNQFQPLTERGVEQVLLPRNLASKPVSKEESQTIPTDIDRSHRPPYSAYANRNAGYKTASVLDRIHVSKDDVEQFREKLAGDESVAVDAFSRAPNLFRKLAGRILDFDSMKPETVEDRLRKIARAEGWPINVIQLQKTASGDLEVMMSSDYCPMAYESVPVSTEKAVSMFGVDSVKQAMAGNPSTVVWGRSGQTVNLPDEMNFKRQPLEKFGQYDVVSASGRVMRGFMIPEVYDFNMNKKAGMKLFTSKKEYALQEKIAGRKVIAGPSERLVPDDINHGETGAFVFRYGEKTAATVPMRVTSFPLISSEKVAFEAYTIDYEPISVEVIPGIAAIAPGEKVGQYYVPAIWEWVSVGDHAEPILDGDADSSKLAYAIGGDPDLCEKKIKIIWNGVNYSFSGPQVNNLSERMDSLEPMKARFLLTAFGLPLEFAEQVLSRAREDGSSSAHVDIYPTGRYKVTTNAIEHSDGSKDTKLASAIKETAEKIRDLAMIKESFVSEDEDTVDSVLALNFVTPQNIIEYVESIDDLRDTTNKLAHLLVASRLGMRPIDPVAVKTAMENMSQVVEELEILRSSLAERKSKKK